MKSSGHSKCSISRFKLHSYEEQMTRMLNYKVNEVYPFEVRIWTREGPLERMGKITYT